MPFNGNGHCVTCDSAYMGDIIAQMARNEWKINMVGTIYSNRTGADIKETCDGMEKCMYNTAVLGGPPTLYGQFGKSYIP